MSSFLDNLELGTAGLFDLGARAVGFDSNRAAGVYADQVARGGASRSAVLDAARAAGADTVVIRASAVDAGVRVTKSGGIESAARQTVEDVADKVKALVTWAPYAAVGAVLVLGVVAAFVYLPKPRA